MDILHLIDRLEEELSQGWRLPLTDRVVVNEQRLWDILDNMRAFIPEEVQQAQRVERERERILAQAKEEAGRVVRLAHEQAEEMTSSHELIQSARAKAAEMMSQAQREAQRFQEEADAYGLDVLTQLEEHLKQVSQTVQNGMRLLSSQGETAANPEDEA